MRFVPKIKRFSVRTRLTVAVLAVIMFSWLMGLVTFRYVMEQDLKRFNAARDANNRLRLEGPMGRLSLAPRGEGPGPSDKWTGKGGGLPPGASVIGPIGPGPGPGPGPGGPDDRSVKSSRTFLNDLPKSDFIFIVPSSLISDAYFW